MLFQQLMWGCCVFRHDILGPPNTKFLPLTTSKCPGLHLWEVPFSCASTATGVLITQLFHLLYLHIQVKLPIKRSGLHKSDLSGPKGAPLASAPWIAPCYSLTSPTGMLILMDHESHDPGNHVFHCVQHECPSGGTTLLTWIRFSFCSKIMINDVQ